MCLQPINNLYDGSLCPVFGPVAAVSLRSYLVDPASSHMLVSKIKPCMSKYKQFIQ